uniref:Uncharacterized protein n=1 Tax=Anguilla anguilla TaxID=7936 RepID=A0A0E9WLK3_ANGAN
MPRYPHCSVSALIGPYSVIQDFSLCYILLEWLSEMYYPKQIAISHVRDSHASLSLTGNADFLY